MTRVRTPLAGIAVALLLVSGLPTAHAGTRVADVQVVATAANEAVLRIRSTGPQPFDVVSHTSRRVRVRLHGARRGQLPAIADGDLGRVTVRNAGRRGVLVTVQLARGVAAHVRQGGDPAVVEIRLSAGGAAQRTARR